MHIGLVGCVKEKVRHPAPARDLYSSALFRSRRFVEGRCDRWFILSTGHGLVDPLQVLDYYDETLANLPRSGVNS